MFKHRESMEYLTNGENASSREHSHDHEVNILRFPSSPRWQLKETVDPKSSLRTFSWTKKRTHRT